MSYSASWLSLRRRALLASVAVLVSCSSPGAYVIPRQPTAVGQYRYGVQMEQAYLSPLRREKKDEDYRRAVAAFRKVLKDFPDAKEITPLAELHLAFLKDKEGNKRQALKDYERLLKAYPDNDEIQVNSMYGAASIYEKFKQFEKAKVYYKQIIDRYQKRTDGSYPGIVQRARYRYAMPNKK